MKPCRSNIGAAYSRPVPAWVGTARKLGWGKGEVLLWDGGSPYTVSR